MAMGSTVRAPALVSGEELFLLFRLGGLLDHAAAAVKAIRGDAVAQVSLPRLRIGGERGRGEPVVGAMHAAPRGRLATFLNGHKFLVREPRANFKPTLPTTCVSTARRAPRRAVASRAPEHPRRAAARWAARRTRPAARATARSAGRAATPPRPAPHS